MWGVTVKQVDAFLSVVGKVIVTSFHAIVGCCKPSLTIGGCMGPCLLTPFPRDAVFLRFVQLETFSPDVILLLHLFLHFLAQKKKEVYL